MAKRVFKFGELTLESNNVLLEAPFKPKKEEVKEQEEVVQYTGPTIEELQAEVDRFKEDWEIEKNQLIEKSRLEAEAIVQKAQSDEEEILEEAKLVASQLVKEAEEKKASTIDEATKEAERILNDANQKETHLLAEFREKGHNEGYEEGFSKGKDDASRVLNKLQSILSAVVDRRNSILKETEEEIIDLVLQMTGKIVKTISETQKGVVIENIRAALKKLKSKTNIVIRVNTNDLGLTKEHAEEFIDSIENVKNVSVVEDALVDIGGCIIETDHGEIDARIKSQLRQMEKAILDVVPISQEK
ncbi:MAG: flagellar assembly protein FliH [Spirochaetales bacterium]|nr:flagellar assembly protein FliH [Spirochaetales bacterium]